MNVRALTNMMSLLDQDAEIHLCITDIFGDECLYNMHIIRDQHDEDYLLLPEAEIVVKD